MKLEMAAQGLSWAEAKQSWAAASLLSVYFYT